MTAPTTTDPADPPAAAERRAALVASDLDRTLIYSAKAVAEMSPSAPGDILCVEIYQDAPLSFMHRDAAEELRRVTDVAVVVPTTTRTVVQFNRITLPGGPWHYAVTSNGGTILVDGVPDTGWRASIDAAARAGGAGLDDVVAALQPRLDASWVTSSRVADSLFHYLVVDLGRLPPDFLAEWDAWCRPRGWNASRQGRKIYTMPDAVCKSRAVAEVRRRLVAEGALSADAPLLAAGDGALDAQLLATADAAIRPRHGELEDLGWTHPGVAVTAAAGIDAGREIIRWFATSARMAL